MKLINTDGMAFVGPGSEWFWTALSGIVLAVTFLGIYRQLSIARSANAFEQMNRLTNEWESERMNRHKLEILLALREGVWKDLASRDSLKVTTIAPFSPAYFALVAARPSLKAALAAGPSILLAGERTNLKIADGGLTEWAPGALARFLQEFDGR